jgi:hypothetical protein
LPVGAEQGASTFYTGEAEEAHRPPRGVVHLERKSGNSTYKNKITLYQSHINKEKVYIECIRERLQYKDIPIVIPSKR